MICKLDNGQYSSVVDFLDSVNNDLACPANSHLRDRYAHGDNHDGRPEWFGAGCRCGDDVQRLVREGWQEGRQRMETLRNSLTALEVPMDRRRRRVRADTGDSLDIHTAHAGRFDIAWEVARRVRTAGPVRLDIAANMLCDGYAHADVLFYRGAAAAVLADILESAGYMVRLTIIFGGTSFYADSKVSCRIVVKDHDLPLDNASISATILPGFFRALGHAWNAAHALTRIDSPSMSVGIGKVEPNEILLSHTVHDHGTAVAFINDTIAKLNRAQGEVAA